MVRLAQDDMTDLPQDPSLASLAQDDMTDLPQDPSLAALAQDDMGDDTARSAPPRRLRSPSVPE